MTIDECILDCIHYTSTDLCKYEKIHWNKSQIEQLTEWLEEYKFLRRWKSDVMNEFCKYDCNSVEEARHNGYNKAIGDFANKMIETMNLGYMYTDKVILDMAEKLKESAK